MPARLVRSAASTVPAWGQLTPREKVERLRRRELDPAEAERLFDHILGLDVADPAKATGRRLAAASWDTKEVLAALVEHYLQVLTPRLPTVLEAWQRALKEAEAGSLRPVEAFVPLASTLAMLEPKDAARVGRLLAATLGVVAVQDDPEATRKVVDAFVRAAINSSGPFDDYRRVARATPTFAAAPNVRRYIL